MTDAHEESPVLSRSTDRADALMDLGRYEQAIPLLLQSLAQTPDDDHLLSRLSYAYYLLEDYDKAENFAQRAIHQQPNNDYAHHCLSWVYMAIHHFSAALEHAQTAVAIDPDDAANLYTLAWAEYHSGHYKASLSAAERAIQLSPDNANLHELMADLLFNMDKCKAAEPHYREALGNNPGSASIHCHLGLCLAHQHKLYEASEHLLAAVKIDPGNQGYRDNLFNIVHHDLMSMPMQSKEDVLAKLDPAVRFFYEDQLSRQGIQGNLRITSIATLWLLALSLLMLFFTWITGEDIKNLTRFVYVVLGVYLALYIGSLVIKTKATRHNNNRSSDA